MDHDPALLIRSRTGGIHPTAIVAEGAVIAPDAVVGPWCSVGPDAVIEDGVRLISHVVVDGRTRIGAGTEIYPFSTIGMAPQDLKYQGEPTETWIGPRCRIREHATIHRGTATGSGVTKIGADCLLMAVVHVAHDCVIGDGVIIANNVVMGGHVAIGDRAVIGGASALHQFTRIGRGAMVGGASGVDTDVVPFATVMGNRARLTGLNVVGLKRSGVDRAALHRLRAAFQKLFPAAEETELVFAERLDQLRCQVDDPLIAELVAFVDAPSRRSLVRSRGLSRGGGEPAG